MIALFKVCPLCLSFGFLTLAKYHMQHIHCGCIASKYLYEYMDYGGVGCVSCVSRLGNHALISVQVLLLLLLLF